jgi:predicted amidophosphoribosyltransferase
LTLAALRYDFPLDKLVQSFKYGHRLALASYFGARLAALLASAALISSFPCRYTRYVCARAASIRRSNWRVR